MQRGILNGMLEQKKDINGQTGETQRVWSLVTSNVTMLVSLFIYF